MDILVTGVTKMSKTKPGLQFDKFEFQYKVSYYISKFSIKSSSNQLSSALISSFHNMLSRWDKFLNEKTIEDIIMLHEIHCPEECFKSDELRETCHKKDIFKMFTWEEMTKRLKEDRVKNEETNTKKKLLPHQMFQKIMDLKKTKNKKPKRIVGKIKRLPHEIIESSDEKSPNKNYDYLFEPQGSDVQDMWDQLYYEEKEFENLKCYDEDRFTIDYELKI